MQRLLRLKARNNTAVKFS